MSDRFFAAIVYGAIVAAIGANILGVLVLRESHLPVRQRHYISGANQ
jgi:hypothetical protein